MNIEHIVSRRSFLGSLVAAAGGKLAAAGFKPIPLGLELYSVRHALMKDLPGTVRGVAKMGYSCVEFYGPYSQWTRGEARQVRAELDQLGVRCHSTHNGLGSFTPQGLPQAIELNRILGARYMVLASPGEVKDAEGWKRVAETLNRANVTLERNGLNAGYHNHDAEWKPAGGGKPMEILAGALDRSIMLQLDVGTCVEAGSDPVAWIRQNPGRIRSLHLKDWSPEQGYKALFGQGVAPWKQIFAAAESVGGVEYYLMEQETSDGPEMEAVRQDFAAYGKLRA